MNPQQNAPDLTGRLMNDAEPELLDFLRSQVNSFIKWDLVHFFQANPSTTDTAENISRYVGRNAREVAQAMDELARTGVLVLQSVGGLSVYALTNDPAVRDLMARFVAACEDHQFRVRAIYHVIRSTKD